MKKRITQWIIVASLIPGMAMAAEPQCQDLPDPLGTPQGLYERSLLADANGNHESAMWGLEQFVRCWPGDRRINKVHGYLAGLLLRHGRYDAALEHLRAYVPVDTEDHADHLLATAKCYEGLGRDDDAVRELHALIARYPASKAANEAKQFFNNAPKPPKETR